MTEKLADRVKAVEDSQNSAAIEAAVFKNDIVYMKEGIKAIETNISRNHNDLVNQIAIMQASMDTRWKDTEKKFITRLEGAAATGTITIIIVILGFWFSHFGKPQ